MGEVEGWCDRMGVEINVEKTKVMRFGKGGRHPKGLGRIQVKRKRIEVVNNFEYLGVTLTPRLSFGRHIARKRVRAAAAMGMMGKLTDVEVKVALNMFRIKILPMVTYGLETFAERLGVGELRQLDRVKSGFLKRVLGLPKNASATLALKMAGERTMVEELADNGYEFGAEAMGRYREGREEAEERTRRGGFMEGPAFRGGGVEKGGASKQGVDLLLYVVRVSSFDMSRGGRVLRAGRVRLQNMWGGGHR